MFRSAHTEDADAVVALVEGAYRGPSSREGWTTEADLLGGQRTDRQEVDALLASTQATIVLASLEGELVGCVCVRLEPPDLAHVGMFAVRPQQQRRGLGHALLVEAERVARDRGASGAEMTVLEQRPELLAWYERRGWRRTGETEPFPYADPRFGLPRRPDLRFLVLAKSFD